VLLRASRHEELVLRDEIAEHVEWRRGRLHELVGPRERVPLDARALTAVVPDIAERDVYVCGPEPFQDLFVAGALEAGVPPSRLHHESFAL
jgi:ferredoxin-NADP reductase